MKSPIGIAKDGKELLIDELSMDWSYEDDIFDLDTIAQGYSWTTLIPIKGNQWAFKYASHISNSRNRLNLIDGFVITYEGSIWWQVSVELQGVNARGTHYQVLFSTVDTESIAILDKSIREVVIDEIPFFNNGYGTYADVIAPFNSAKKSNVRFPTIQFYLTPALIPYITTQSFPGIPLTGDKSFYRDTLANAWNSNRFFIPCFEVSYVLRQIFGFIGYQVEDGFSQSDIPPLLIHHNRPVNQIVDISNNLIDFRPVNRKILVNKYLPDITVKELLADIQFYTGSSAILDPETKTLSIKKIAREYEQTKAISLQTQLNHEVKIEQVEFSNYELKYDLTGGTKTSKPSGQFIGEFKSLSSFKTNVAASNYDENDYAFITELNAYYKVITIKGIDHVVFDSIPYSSYSSGEFNRKTTTPKIQPTAVKSYYNFELREFNNDVTFIREGSIYQSSENLGIAGKYVQFKVKDQQHDFIPLSAPILVSSGPSGETRLNLQYNGDLIIESLLVGENRDEIIPVSFAAIYYPESDQRDNDNFEGGILFWHGLQPKATSGSYPCAMADSHHYAANPLSEYSLDLQTEYGLPSRIYSNILNIIKNARLLTFTGNLSPFTIRKLMLKTKKGRFREGLFRFKSLRANITNEGINDQEIEGYSL